MARSSSTVVARHPRIVIASVAVVSTVMWYAAAKPFSSGLLDLVVFVPPGAALGLVSTWSAHAFAPERFSWQRGLIGAITGGLVVSPVITFLVALSAAWAPASFQFVFNLGAWIAVAGGLAAGGSSWLIERFSAWYHARAVVRR